MNSKVEFLNEIYNLCGIYPWCSSFRRIDVDGISVWKTIYICLQHRTIRSVFSQKYQRNNGD